MKKFKLVACGGTFDHFHKGHREFLRFAISKGEKVVLGLTNDEYVKNKLANETIESYRKRFRSIAAFLTKEKIRCKVKIISIKNIFGPTMLRTIDFDTIVVSENSLKGAEIINQKRKEADLPELKILIKKMVKAEDGEVISSLRIRKGIINREGKLYIKPSWFLSTITISNKVRKILKKPLGRLIETEIKKNIKINPAKIIAVGDIVTKYFNENNLGPKIAAVDFSTGRKKQFSNSLQLGFSGKQKNITIQNPSGSLSVQLFKAIKNIFENPDRDRIVIQINGEEDLVVLPFLLAAPLGFYIYYGQPGRGVVEVEVSEKNKERIFNLLNNA
ncbi:MAG: pantetheine-phosphate adenylyltransferase [bacterium]|nr:pantetheine-phosphate adenylyltransferase [bacterium]